MEVRRTVRLPERMLSEALKHDENFSSVVRQALDHFLRTKHPAWREVSFHGGGEAIEMALTLASNAQTLRRMDFTSGSTRVVPSIKRELDRALTPAQSRRVQLVLQGLTYTEIGRREGCSKQAVHRALTKAYPILKKDGRFLLAMQRQLSKDEDSSVDVLALVEALDERTD